MPSYIFTEAERAKLDRFPEEITRDDLNTFFTLFDADKDQIPIYSAPYTRLGFALQLCTLRFLGFVSIDLTRIPPVVVEQTNQASCLNLLTNAVVVWNTLYMARALEELPREGPL